MILSLFVKVSILNVLALSLLQAQGVSSLGRVGGGGGVGRGGSTFKKESPFNIIQTNKNNSIWIQRIREALETDKFVSYFQPIVDI